MSTTLEGKNGRVMDADIATILARYSEPGTPVKARLEGVAPGFLQHAAEAQIKQEAWTAANKTGRSKPVPSYEDESEWGAYRLPNGDLYLPARNILRSVTEAAKKFKLPKGPGSMMKLVASGVTVPVDVAFGFTLLEPATDKAISEYEILVSKVVIQRASIFKGRALVPTWAAEVRFLVDEEAVSIPSFCEMLAYAGSRCGVGDWRPEKGGQYGRFTITQFEVN